MLTEMITREFLENDPSPNVKEDLKISCIEIQNLCVYNEFYVYFFKFKITNSPKLHSGFCRRKYDMQQITTIIDPCLVK
jgi:hypothetical protein